MKRESYFCDRCNMSIDHTSYRWHGDCGKGLERDLCYDCAKAYNAAIDAWWNAKAKECGETPATAPAAANGGAA